MALTLVEKDLADLEEKNKNTIKGVFDKVKDRYEEALSMNKDDPAFKDKNIYIAENMADYGVEFTSYLEPNFIQDMQANKEWYKENSN